MEKAFMFGLVCGMAFGALLVANSQKARRLVEKGQTEVINQVEELTDKVKEEKDAARKANLFKEKGAK